MHRLPTAAFCCLLGQAAAQDDPRLAWLSAHAIPLASIDPAHDDFDDLEPLRAVLGDARIVQLGEPSHGDGTAFLAKTRLVRFLHERMGFDVLAFESGLYGCSVAWQRLRAGGDAAEAMSAGVFPIWMQSAQVKPLADYLAATAKGPRPLELCGFDCQFTGTATAEQLAPDLRKVLYSLLPPVDSSTRPVLEQLAARMDQLAEVPAADREPALAALTAFADGLARADVAAALAPGTAAFWQQLAKSWRAYAAYTWNPEKGALAAQFNPRDAQMADNLLWLARTAYPERKILVWAATMHIQRNPDTIDTRSRDLDYTGVRPMGHLVAAALGERVFTLGFVAYEGRAGLPWGTPWAIPPAPADSLEDLCVRAKLGDAIVPFRGLPEGHWLRQPLVARPLGYSPMVADWTRVLDGVVFHRVMKPSRMRHGDEEIAAAQDLVAMLEARWQRVEALAAAGNAWVDKQTFVGEFQTWRDIREPDAGGIAAEQQRVRDWVGKRGGQPAFEWRAQQLLAAMAEACGDRAGAQAALAKAIAAYPDTDCADPMRYSQFQHLVNQQAGWIGDAEGTDKAIDYVVGLLQQDPRMRYFFPVPWRERLTAARYQAMVGRVRRAYEERSQRLPRFADEARRFAGELGAVK